MKPQLKAVWYLNPDYTDTFTQIELDSFVSYAVERAHEYGFDLTIEVGLRSMYVVDSDNDDDKYDLQEALEEIYEDWLQLEWCN